MVIALGVYVSSVSGPADDPIAQALPEITGEPSTPVSALPDNLIHENEIKQTVNRDESSILFDDGDVIPIRWHQKPIPSIDRSGAREDNYAIWRSQAEAGNEEAAFVLWTMLNSCKFAYQKPEELDNALNITRQTQTIKLPGMDQAHFVTRESAEDWERILLMSFENCVGITDEQKSERNKWLKMSSDAGYPLAMMEYSAVKKDFESAMELEQTRWRSGDVDAMFKLYELYQQEYESGARPENKIIAYSHLLVFHRISEQKWAASSKNMQHFKPKIDEAAARLQPYELEQATVMAKDMIRSNPNCCFRH